MDLVLFEEGCIQQPRWFSRIDWSNPLTRNLEVAINSGSGFFDCTGKNTITVNGDVVVTHDGLYFPGAVSDYLTVSGNAANSSTPFTIFSLVTYLSGSAVHPTLISRGSTSSNQWMLRFASSTTHSFYGNSGSINVSVAQSPVYSVPLSVAATIDPSANNTPGRLYINGGELSSLDSTGIMSVTTAPLVIGGANEESTRTFTGLVKLILVFDRYLTAEEVKELYNNPWQVFEYKEEIAYFDAVSGSGASDLSGAAAAQSTANAGLKLDLSMSCASLATATANGVMSQSLALGGSAASVTIADGTATITASLSGEAFNQAFASGSLNQFQSFTSDAQAQSDANGSVGLSLALSGNSVAQALSAANLSTGNGFEGNAAVSASASGYLTAVTDFSSNAAIVVTSAGGVTMDQSLSGVSASVVNGSGDLSLQFDGLSGGAIIEALAGGSMALSLSFDAAALSQVVSAATLSMLGESILAMIDRYTVKAANRNMACIAQPRNYTVKTV